MGTVPIVPDAVPGNPSPTTKQNPYRDLEAVQVGALWWLCVNADPERLAYGTFGSKAQAEKHRDRCIDGWDAMHRINNAGEQQVKVFKENREGIDEAWGIIANVGGGNWKGQSQDWIKAVRRWEARYLIGKSEVRS